MQEWEVSNQPSGGVLIRNVNSSYYLAPQHPNTIRIHDFVVQSDQRFEWLVYQDNTTSHYIQPPMFRGGNLILGVSPIRSSSPHVDFERRELEQHTAVHRESKCAGSIAHRALLSDSNGHSTRQHRGICPTGAGSSTSLPTLHFQSSNRAYTTQSSALITRISSQHGRHCGKDIDFATPLSQR
jgi:hypothetical protein